MNIRWYQLWWLWLSLIFLLIGVCWPEILPFDKMELAFISRFWLIILCLLLFQSFCKARPEIIGELHSHVHTVVTLGIIGIFIGVEMCFPISRKFLIVIYSLGLFVGSGFLIYGYREFKQAPSFIRFLPLAFILLFLFMQVTSLLLYISLPQL